MDIVDWNLQQQKRKKKRLCNLPVEFGDAQEMMSESVVDRCLAARRPAATAQPSRSAVVADRSASGTRDSLVPRHPSGAPSPSPLMAGHRKVCHLISWLVPPLKNNNRKRAKTFAFNFLCAMCSL